MKGLLSRAAWRKKAGLDRPPERPFTNGSPPLHHEPVILSVRSADARSDDALTSTLEEAMSLLLWIVIIAGALVLLGAGLRRTETGRGGPVVDGPSHVHPPTDRRHGGGGCH